MIERKVDLEKDIGFLRIRFNVKVVTLIAGCFIHLQVRINTAQGNKRKTGIKDCLGGIIKLHPTDTDEEPTQNSLLCRRDSKSTYHSKLQDC